MSKHQLESLIKIYLTTYYFCQILKAMLWVGIRLPPFQVKQPVSAEGGGTKKNSE